MQHLNMPFKTCVVMFRHNIRPTLQLDLMRKHDYFGVEISSELAQYDSGKLL